MPPVPTTIFPVSERFVNIGRETLGFGTAAGSYVTVPVTTFLPDDKPIWIPDEAWRASMAMEYDLLQGPIWTETTFGGPAYGDTIGHLFYNILGDNVATGTAVTPNTTTTGTSNTPGATVVTVAVGTAFTAGMWIQVDNTGTGNAEIVQVSATGGATTIPIVSTPLRFTHAAGVTVTNTTAPYNNGFGLLNGGNGQPPSHTFLDRTQIPGSAHFNTVQYAYGCLSDLELTGNATGILTYTATMASYFHQYPATTPTASISAVRAQPNWRSLVGLQGVAGGATLVNDIAEWRIKLTRVVEPIPTNDGSQNPFVIARGKFSATAQLKFMPSIDETALTLMLNNTQPQLQILFSNGGTGASNITYTIDSQLTAFDTAKINESGALFGYDVTAKLIANTTNTSGTNVTNTGGYSPVHIGLSNATPYY